MSKSDRDKLNDEQFIVTILCALLKKEGGTIRIPEELMDSVVSKDMLTIYFDEKAKELIVSSYFLKETDSTHH